MYWHEMKPVLASACFSHNNLLVVRDTPTRAREAALFSGLLLIQNQ